MPGRRRNEQKEEMRGRFIARKKEKRAVRVNEKAVHCPQKGEPR
ncbi:MULTISPECIES: hypothetical protein [unclassified Bacillus (in: firmicutes)]|nr:MULTISPECIES: hypothetical protein [unclassified Bacillus (in: firmicutes)]